MSFMKVYNTSAMTAETWNKLREWGCFRRDGYAEYRVGYFHGESLKFAKEEPRRAAFYLKQAAENKEVDDWFITNAANSNETVLIYHG